MDKVRDYLNSSNSNYSRGVLELDNLLKEVPVGFSWNERHRTELPARRQGIYNAFYASMRERYHYLLLHLGVSKGVPRPRDGYMDAVELLRKVPDYDFLSSFEEFDLLRVNFSGSHLCEGEKDSFNRCKEICEKSNNWVDDVVKEIKYKEARENMSVGDMKMEELLEVNKEILKYLKFHFGPLPEESFEEEKRGIEEKVEGKRWLKDVEFTEETFLPQNFPIYLFEGEDFDFGLDEDGFPVGDYLDSDEDLIKWAKKMWREGRLGKKASTSSSNVFIDK